MSKTEMWGLEQSPGRREGSIHSGWDHMTSKVGVRVKRGGTWWVGRVVWSQSESD